MKQRVTIKFPAKTPPAMACNIETFRPVSGRGFYTFEGDIEVTVERLQRFVEVQLIDPTVTSERQRDMFWTYEDVMPTPLKRGELVLVPFGWRNNQLLAIVQETSDTPAYDGPCGIKTVSSRAKVSATEAS